MAMNRVQFQSGLSMVVFMQHYGAEAKCYRTLYRAPAAGFSLPRLAAPGRSDRYRDMRAWVHRSGVRPWRGGMPLSQIVTQSEYCGPHVRPGSY